MHSRPFDFDPMTGMTETFHFDPYTDRLVMENTQRIDPILDANKRFMCDAEMDYNAGEFHRVAAIPHALLPELHTKGIMDMGGRILDQKALKRFLNDRDNLWLRTRPGQV
jgi:hypothetical protein